MALTETRPDDTSASAGPPRTGTEDAPTLPAPAGLAGVLGTGDHTHLGRLWIASSLVFLAVSGVLGAVLSVQRIDTSGTDVNYLQGASMHSVQGVFLFLLPLLVGLATAVVPLQVGARTVAFPRAAAAAFWTWLVAGVLLVASYAIDGGPYGERSDGVGLFIVALGLVVVALSLAMICVVTTVLALRAPGMGLARVPLFAWSNAVAGVMWLLTLPVLAAGLVLLYLDQRYGQVFLGGPEQLYGRISWALGQPQVYAFAVPALGIVAEVVPVMAGRRPRPMGHTGAMAAIGAFGALGFGAYAQRAFNPEVLTSPVFVAMSLAALVPVVALAALWADTLRSGRPRLASPLIYAAAGALMLLVGVAAGVLTGVEPAELVDTTWATAQVHYVVLGTAICALGGVHYWATKITGRTLPEGLGRLAAVVLLLGTVGLAFPDLVSGLFGDDEASVVGVEALNVLSALGGLAVLLGVGCFLVALLGGLRRGGRHVVDPWSGHTLEWLVPSPPAGGPRPELPLVASPTPALDTRERDDAAETSP